MVFQNFSTNKNVLTAVSTYEKLNEFSSSKY